MSDRKFGVRVKVYNPHSKEYDWLWQHPSGSTQRYEWETSEKAHQMKEMCYPQTTTDWVRVEEIPRDPV